jgi:PhnB protein
MAVKPIPEGYHTVTPYLLVKGVAELLPFLESALGAKVNHQMTRPDGTVGHADITIGNSHVMLGETADRWPAMPAMLYLYVEDADAMYQRALDAGGTSIMPMADQFYGDRHGAVADPSGNQWWIATHVEDVPPDELARRAAAHQPPG